MLSGEEIVELQRIVREVPVADELIRYALALVRQTRVDQPGVPDFVKEAVAWGAGPRAVQFLILGAKARALLDGNETHVSQRDLQALAKPVLRHRLVLSFTAESEGVTADTVVDRILEATPTNHDELTKRCPIPSDFCILTRSSGSRGWTFGLDRSWKAFWPACIAAPISASPSSFSSTASTWPATIPATWTGKSGRSRTGLYVKQFEEDTNLRCTLLVDVSASMRYGTGALNKYEYGATVAASLAYLILRQQDAVGCVWPSTTRPAPSFLNGPRRNHL